MPHINLPKEFPGIRSLFMFRPETAAPLNHLVQTLLHDPHPTLSAGERELIASYVSSLNECKYCATIHGAIAKHQLGNNVDIVAQVINDPCTASISNKLKALLKIAAKVQAGGKQVGEEDITNAREEGATDIEIHDTVLIAAAFCMYNRYVDGLATWQPDDDELYDKMGEQRAREGYLTPPFKIV
ncbi:MAG: Carboxymuconolactone decarboxylase family protein [Mucilaginibacter sp.]|nr:Carboxymuconolactone decarboxylase family protein [Mucilaginibacter sp.]